MELTGFQEAIGDCRTVLVIGDTDTGKSSLVQLMVQFYRSKGEKVFHVDLDMGQSTIGPPTTIGLVTPDARQYLYFVGNITPYGIFREIERGVRRFREILGPTAHDRVMVDTPGLVHDDFAWSLAKMELRAMEADFVVLIDRKSETARIAEGLVELRLPFRKFKPRAAVLKKSYATRTTYRRRLFLDYFTEASIVEVPFKGKEIIHLGEQERMGLLVGLLDSSDFLVSLGMIVGIEKEAILVLAHPSELQKVATIKFGRYSADLNGKT